MRAKAPTVGKVIKLLRATLDSTNLVFKKLQGQNHQRLSELSQANLMKNLDEVFLHQSCQLQNN